MNVEERIRKSEAQFRSHTVDKEAFKARFFARVANNPNPLTSTHRSTIPSNRRRPTAIMQFAAAGLGLVIACILVIVVMRTPNTDSYQLAAAKSNYFGVEPPFQAVLPAHALSGYRLTSSGWLMSFQNSASHFVQYEAQFSKGGPISVQNLPLSINELPGDSVTIKQQAGIPVSGIAWKHSVRIHNQTYYISTTWQSQVGFVKNHVVYILSIPSRNMATTILQCAENMSVIAPIQWTQRSAATYKDSIDNISFHPVVPKLPSTYLNVGTWSQVSRKGHTMSELFVLDYQIRNEAQKSIQVVEIPLGKAAALRQSTSNSRMVTWTDKRLGIQFTIQGSASISKSELQDVVDFLKSSAKRMKV